MPSKRSQPSTPEPAVLRAGGDQQAFGGDGLAAVQVQDGVGLLELQARHRRGDRQMGAELVGLEYRAAGQLAAGQAGGEAEIVLDAHAAARLASRRGLLQHHGPQPFGRPVDRGRQTRRAGAHHDQVVHRLLQRLADADRVGQLPVRRVAQHQPVSAGDHRRVRLGHAELLEQPVHLRVGLHVHPGEQHAVLGQEVADPKGVRGVARADHPQAGEVGRLAQELPPGDERLKNDVAQVRALVQDAPQRLARNLNHLAVAPGDGADDRRGAGQVGDVAGELALAMDGDPSSARRPNNRRSRPHPTSRRRTSGRGRRRRKASARPR